MLLLKTIVHSLFGECPHSPKNPRTESLAGVLGAIMVVCTTEGNLTPTSNLRCFFSSPPYKLMKYAPLEQD